MKSQERNLLCLHFSAVCLQSIFMFAGLCVNDQYLIAQYHIEGGIDVYDRVTLKHLFRLNGHEYGGQCVEISGKLTCLFTFFQLFVYNFVNFQAKSCIQLPWILHLKCGI